MDDNRDSADSLGMLLRIMGNDVRTAYDGERGVGLAAEFRQQFATDVVLDRDLGPLVLELNARPGLAIQIANRQGLLRRLKICEERADFAAPAAQRIEFAKQEFRHPVGASG